MFDINSYNDYGTADWATSDALAEAYGLFVVLQPDGQFAVASTAADPNVTGVLRDNCLEGEAPAVRTGDITYVWAEEDLPVGTYVTNTDTGTMRAADGGEIVLGQVIDKDVAAGEEGKILLFKQAARVAASTP